MSKQMNLYECASIFTETMDEQFGNKADGCAIWMVCTDGEHITTLINGSDDLLAAAMAHVMMDKSTRDLVIEGASMAIKAEKGEAADD